MAVGDTRLIGLELRAVQPGDAEQVRHFDQLDHAEQRAFLRLYEGRSAAPILESGEVIVFTEYFLVESC